MADESYWVERAQSAETKLATLKQAYEPALDRVKEFKANFGVKERADGSIVVDYDKFVARLGLDGALALRRVIDETYRISGEPGAKPRVSVAAA